MTPNPSPKPFIVLDADHSVDPMAFKTDAETRSYCLERWPDAEFAFCYLSELAAPGVLPPAQERVVLNVIHKVPDEFEGEVPSYGHVIANEYDTDVWCDAYYYGKLADDVELENAEGGATA